MKRALVAGLVLTCPAAAEDLLVGPAFTGAPFQSINAALAVASPGDVVRLLPGNDFGFTLTIPVDVVGPGSSQARVGASTISGIGAGESVLLSGFEIEVSPTGILPPVVPALAIGSCPGTVVLKDMVLDVGPPLTGNPGTDSPGLEASAVGLVLVGCGVSATTSLGGWSAPGMVVDASQVWSSDTVVTAGFQIIGSPVGDAGIHASQSVLTLSRARVTGGPGSVTAGGSLPGGPAVLLDASVLYLGGGPGSFVRGGDSPASGAVPTADGGPGLQVVNGGLVFIGLDASVSGGLASDGSPSPAAVVTSGQVVSTSVTMPSLVAQPTTVGLGAPFAFELSGEPAGTHLLWLGLALGPRATFAGILGTAHLDASTLLFLGTVVLDGTGLATVPGVVPSVPALLCTTVWAQSLQLGALPFLGPPTGLTILP